MDVIEAIRLRRSIRLFDGAPVDRATIDQIVLAAGQAPSRMNSQPWHFHIAVDKGRARVAEVMAMTTAHLSEYIKGLDDRALERAGRFYAELGNAPVVIGISSPATDDASVARDNAISVGAALQNLLLAATENGLAACSISVPHWIADQLAGVFGVTDGWEVLSIVVLGHPDETPGPRDLRGDVSSYVR
jgi:nitroreductase